MCGLRGAPSEKLMLTFSTKAGTLSSLKDKLTTAQIAPLVVVPFARWRSARDECVSLVSKSLAGDQWIVRSSCKWEDQAQSSFAGAFLSVKNVRSENLATAIDDVFDSYGDRSEEDEVLVQEMLAHVTCSGVAFSHDPNTCSPYRVINWADGPDTSVVTGGLGGRVWQQAAATGPSLDAPFSDVIALLEELLSLFNHVPIDCEFAYTEDSRAKGGRTLWLLQVRPLVLHKVSETEEQQTRRLLVIEDKLRRGLGAHPFLMGKRAVYGVMPDWNPAEIIGVRPKPLALSLYRELITDSVWAYQRDNYGYRNLRSFPLMPHFFGLPYVDVRVSFNSFIPADLDEGLAGRLVDHYIDHLLSKPALHDKVEFEVVFSCYTLDLPERLKRLQQQGFTDRECNEIEHSLRALTNRIVHPEHGLWRKDFAKLDVLSQRRELLLASNSDTLERIYWLLEDAKRYGTLPFAGLARAGFVSIQLLRSLVAVGVLSDEDYDSFLASTSTVSRQMARDRATLDRTSFLNRYGHLRPGTYDILSPRYDEATELYFDWEKRPETPEPASAFSLTLPQMRDIARLLREHELQPDPVNLFDFLQAGIEMRELAKFRFTQNLSLAISLITEYGRGLGFAREDLAFCDVRVFQELHIAGADPHQSIERSVLEGKARYAETERLSLPPVLSQPEDVWAFEWPELVPNFVTQKQVTAPVVSHVQRERLVDAVVCIPNADPGFDWLFAQPIAGLITAWGGANSHMAIRAGEQGLPAVIGAGEVLYRRWSNSHRLHIDCAGRRVEVLA